MQAENINKIYDRLLDIKVEIESDPLPDPKQINIKIAQIHVYIDEVEKYYIKASKEISIIQRTLNDEMASYESKKEDLLANNPEVKELPSIKDREAKTNQMLKEDRKQIKQHENEANDLNNLLRAINLKLKNLNRTNGDIKNQIRIMEAQIRLGIPPINDEGARTLQEELKRSLLNEDSFKNAETKIKESSIVDPSSPLNTDEILEEYDVNSEDSEEEIPENLLDPLQEHGVLKDDDPIDLDAEIIQEAQDSIHEEKLKINIDEMLDSHEQKIETKGGDVIKEKETKSEDAGESKPGTEQKPDSINIDELLSQFS